MISAFSKVLNRCIVVFAVAVFYSPICLSVESIDNKVREQLKKPTVLQDLAYGNILFDYYRGKPLAALNGILVAQKKQLLPNHQQSARLLAGAIYLDMGMLSHAQFIFNELLTRDDLKSELLARLEFYLGKLHYRQGDYSQAQQRFEKVVASLEPELKDECLLMLGNISMSYEQKKQARDWLSQVSENSKLVNFSRFNLAMAWLRESEIDKALPLLTSLSGQVSDVDENQLKDDSGVLSNLQDKAYIALGYYYLSQKNIPSSQTYLSKVSLNSTQANKALLGMGWSYLEQSKIEKALTHWLTLGAKDKRDLAVQEVLLAIPFAYQKANALQQALDAYLSASEIYQKQITLLNDLLHQIEQQGLFEQTFEQINSQKKLHDRFNNPLQSDIQDSHLFGETFDYYLFEILSEHQFNERYRSYQKLSQLVALVNQWEQQLPMFDEIVKTNKIRFDEKIPLVDAYLKHDSFDEFNRTLKQLRQTINELKQNQKMHLLANSKQAGFFKRIAGLTLKIEALPENTLSEQQLKTAQRAQGILQWQLESGKTAKIWPLQKSANQIESVLAEMKQRKISLASARNKSKVRYAEFEQKINHNKKNLLGLNAKIKTQMAIQLELLKSQIVSTLNQRKASLEYLLLQADLSIARLQSQAVLIPEVD